MCVQADLQRFDLLHRLFKEPCRHFTQRNYSADNKALDESLYFALLSLGATGLCWTHRVSGYWIKKFPSIKGVSTNIRLLFVKTNKVFHLMILHPKKKIAGFYSVLVARKVATPVFENCQRMCNTHSLSVLLPCIYDLIKCFINCSSNRKIGKDDSHMVAKNWSQALKL